MDKAKSPIVIPDTDDLVEATIVPDDDIGAIREDDTDRCERQLPRSRKRPAASTDQTEIADSEDEVGNFWPYWPTRDLSLVSHQFHGLNFTNQGVLICDHPWFKNGQPQIDTTYFQYPYPVAAPLSTPLKGRDIIGPFDPSRLPPRIAFRLPLARLVFGKEIDDLLKKDRHSPPAAIQILLNDPKYRHWHCAPSKLVVKREIRHFIEDV